MYRYLVEKLIEWKDDIARKPLLVRGARQVGKSYLVESFGKEHFENLVVVNFEYNKNFIACFKSLDPQQIINAIQVITGQTIEAGKSLLFLDEIQECPAAILSLRYFKEQMPALHVIAAGSLLEFTLNNPEYRMPVGRVQSIFVKPLSFKEFLLATMGKNIVEYLEKVTLEEGIEESIHLTLLEKLKQYFFLGGMPEIVAYFLQQGSYNKVQELQYSLLDNYTKDFGKYNSKIKYSYLQKIFEKAPGLVATKFKYVNIDSELQTRDLKPALNALVEAGLIYLVFSTSGSGLPFNATVNERNFKLLFLDVGLVNFVSKLSPQAILTDDLLLLNRGAIAEQYVGQELMTLQHYMKGDLYYWSREAKGSNAEVDYLINIDSDIYPVEVKAGITGRLKSIQIFLQEKNLPLGIRISQKPLSLEGNILSIPLYMVHETKRIIKTIAYAQNT